MKKPPTSCGGFFCGMVRVWSMMVELASWRIGVLANSPLKKE